MNGASSKIEIIKPFEEAFGLTKQILFQPFNFEKWLIIGFAAFLTHLNGGGFNFPLGGNWNASPSEQQTVQSLWDQLTPVWIALIAAIALLVIAFFLLVTWIRSRGVFIFIDCIVRNRGAIVQPWKEYRAEGNSYFLFSLLLLIGIVSLLMVTALMIIVPIVLLNRYEQSGWVFLPLLLFMIVFPVLLLFLALVQFVAPVMYRRRCGAWLACNDLLLLVAKRPGVFVLYLLFGFVVGIAVAIALVTAMCLTCCIAAIPYVGTVIFLPVYVFLQSFSLLFIRQFGSDYDVWAGIPATPPPLPS